MTIQDSLNDIDFLCGSTSATYSITNKLRNMKIHYYDAARLIWESDNGWHFDDSNNTGTPIAYKTLTQGVGTYSIPTSAFKIEQVEVLDNGGQWHKLIPLKYQDIELSPEQYLSTPNLPTHYALEGTQFRLLPAPVSTSVTLLSGVALRISRDIDFISANSATFGFATPFHRFVSYCTSLDFVQDDKLRQFLILQRDRISNGMVRFYSKRGEEFPSRVMPKSKGNWRQYT